MTHKARTAASILGQAATKMVDRLSEVTEGVEEPRDLLVVVSPGLDRGGLSTSARLCI